MGCCSSGSNNDEIIKPSSSHTDQSNDSCCSCRIRWCCCCYHPPPKHLSDSEPDPIIYPTYKSEIIPDPVILKIEPERLLNITPVGKVFSYERFNKRGFSENNLYPLIQGFEDEQLLSLEETLEEFIDEQPQLSDYIKEAKANCNKSTDHCLTEDESAAIYIYSMRNDEQNGVYDLLEKAWESRERSIMKPWFKYLRLFQSALDKLPNVTENICQVVPFDKTIEKLLEGNLPTIYTCMATCLASESENIEHIEEMVNQKLALLSFENVSGKDMSSYSQSRINLEKNLNSYVSHDGKDITDHRKDFKEILTGLAIELVKTGYFEDSNGLTYIYLKAKEKEKIQETEPCTSIPEEPKQIRIPRRELSPDIPKISCKKPTISSDEISNIIYERHFQCPRYLCRNSCNGDHESNHCRGFSFIHHNCSHHCTPHNRCFSCKKHVIKLHQCNQCNWRFCQKCSFKSTTLIHIEKKEIG
ncbi:hypothetical protein I4U23_000136 [Adineta vaga]|nr:hypothetical protein I4U23_000136 [Adineta vaga]